MFNPNMYRNNSYYANNYTPFNVARNTSEVFYTPKKALNMKGLIKNAEKGIDTISSIIPLATKVTPLISVSKDFMVNLKSQFLKNKTKNTKKEKVEAEIVDEPISKDTNTNNFSKKEETKPNNPYF